MFFILEKVLALYIIFLIRKLSVFHGQVNYI